LTLGGLDDHNNFDHAGVALCSYGLGAASVMKLELVAPNSWVAAPLLPGTAEAQEAATLFRRRGQAAAEARIAELRLITPHYLHADGSSFFRCPGRRRCGLPAASQPPPHACTGAPDPGTNG
jgi:hypothetical protein